MSAFKFAILYIFFIDLCLNYTHFYGPLGHPYDCFSTGPMYVYICDRASEKGSKVTKLQTVFFFTCMHLSIMLVYIQYDFPLLSYGC